MTQTTIPSGDNSLLPSTQVRKVGRLERIVGPDNYRILQGLFKTPASIIGFSLIVFFVLVAVFAPVLAPPKATGDPFQIPRDGFGPDPKPPGTEWKRNAPPVVPGWYKVITGNDKWVHLFGTAAGQYDIYYGIIWGTRTAFKTGLVVMLVTLIIGVVVVTLNANYAGAVENEKIPKM
jgi:peptide/nickel transport system permease protein